MNKFKDERTGNWYTQGLFYELSYNSPKYAIYTLKDEAISIVVDGETRELAPIKQLYLSCEDPTEYEFATTHLGGWNHWQRILNKTKLLHPYIEDWREELEVKLRSKGVKAMIGHSMSDKGQQAAKWLSDKGWSEKKRGAPSKEEKAREMKIQTRMSDELDEDLNRLLN